LAVGTIDQKPWTDVAGNVDLSFRSYVEQSKFGEAGNSTSRAVELAAGLVDYSYGDSNCHAIVVLADGVTALPWREARDLLLG
jgi:hypothetical protein